MKFTVSSTKLLGQLRAVANVINRKNTIAILDNVLFQIEGNSLTLTASDTETTIISTMEIENVEGEGKVAVAAKLLLDSLKEFSEQPLSFEVNDQTMAMIIRSENGEFNFVGANGNDYPQPQGLSEEAFQIDFPSSVLLSGINATLFSTADDELRPVMNGVFLDFKPEYLTFVATDAHKLVRYINTSVQVENPANFILPKKAASLLQKSVLDKQTENVHIAFDAKNVVFTFPNATVICRQVEGRFPNYNAVIPQNNHHKVLVDRLSLLNALRRVSVFSSQGNSLVKLAIQPGQITVSAQDIDFSTSAEERLACQYEDEALNIGFKATFLIDILTNLNAETVRIELADPSRAGLILPFENAENEELLMLLMPMLLND